MKKRRFLVNPGAARDLAAEYEYLQSHAGTRVAERFLKAAGKAFALLAKMPHAGQNEARIPASAEPIRRWHIPDFEQFLVYYRVTAVKVEVIAVIHGARDIGAILAAERVFDDPSS